MIESISIELPLGSQAECACYHLKALRSGTIEYRGIANVEVMGARRGLVEEHEFDAVARALEASGILELPEHDETQCVSTVGEIRIGVKFTNSEERVFTREAMGAPKLFWSIADLFDPLVTKTVWI